MLKRRIRPVLKVLLVALVLLFAFLVFERVRGEIALANYKRELIAKGEKLTLGELIPPVPEGENGAPEFVQAVERLQPGAVLPHSYPPAMKIMPSGRAVVCFREPEWVEAYTYCDGELVNEPGTNRWEQLAADLKTNAAILAQMRLALEKPVFNNKLEYSQGFKIRFDHLAPAKQGAQWLGAASQLALHEVKPHEVVDNLVALIRLPRLLAQDRILVSELVRVAIAAIASAATWEALQADGWTDEDLAKIQQAWQAEEFLLPMVRCLEVERVLGQTTFARLRPSNAEAARLLFWQDFVEWSDEERKAPRWLGPVAKSVYCGIWRFAWSHQDERHYLAGMQRLLEISRKAVEEKSYEKILPLSVSFKADIRANSFYDTWRFPLSLMSLESESGVVKRAMRAETERSLVICAIALKRHQLRHGKLPESLDALVPEFLSSVPTDYMDGQPMKYRLNADGTFTLYSIGEDGKDDGGDASLPPDQKGARIRWNRRDFVWPLPALPDEVEAYRQETREN